MGEKKEEAGDSYVDASSNCTLGICLHTQTSLLIRLPSALTRNKMSLSQTEALVIYNGTLIQFSLNSNSRNPPATRKYFTLISCLLVSPLTFGFFINKSISWVNVELFAPMFFIITYLSAPLGPTRTKPGLSLKPTVLPFLFLAHYLKLYYSVSRPGLRSDSRVKVPLIGALFNIVNGSLLGSYLSAETTISYLIQKSCWTFWIGVTLWFLGLTRNMTHNHEILYHYTASSWIEWSNPKVTGNNKKRRKGRKGREVHCITGGPALACISSPNYLFEWIEWLGFAIASAPLPFSFQSSPSSLTFSLLSLLTSAPQLWLPSLTPPYIFLIHLYRVGTTRLPSSADSPYNNGPSSPFLFFLVSLFFVLVLCYKICTDVL